VRPPRGPREVSARSPRGPREIPARFRQGRCEVPARSPRGRNPPHTSGCLLHCHRRRMALSVALVDLIITSWEAKERCHELTNHVQRSSDATSSPPCAFKKKDHSVDSMAAAGRMVLEPLASRSFSAGALAAVGSALRTAAKRPWRAALPLPRLLRVPLVQLPWRCR